MPAAQAKTSKVTIAARERERQVLALRKTGASFEDIARALGYKERTGAYKAFRRALAAIPREEANELRSLEGQRLDDALLGIYQRVVAGDLEAIDRLVRIVSERARLLGLNLSPDLAVNLNVQKAYIGIPVDDV